MIPSIASPATAGRAPARIRVVIAEPIGAEWRLGLAVLGLAALWTWESLQPALEHPRRLLHAGRNLTVAGVNAVLVAICCAAATAAAAHWAESRGVGLLNHATVPSAAGFLGGLLALDLWSYWQHRLYHRFPLLWRFHRMHHSDPEMDVSTALRFHPGELLLSAALRLALIPPLGLSLAAVVAYSALVVATTQFHHANIRLGRAADRALRWWIVSPQMHQVHHSRRREETNSNYATVLSVWDRLFGSYTDRDDCGEIRFGLDELDDERNQSITGMALTPFRSPR